MATGDQRLSLPKRAFVFVLILPELNGRGDRSTVEPQRIVVRGDA
jgi:hypothetical protein